MEAKGDWLDWSFPRLGFPSLQAASLGAASVLATDWHPNAVIMSATAADVNLDPEERRRFSSRVLNHYDPKDAFASRAAPPDPSFFLRYNN